jgi:dethiobiotin synthetase
VKTYFVTSSGTEIGKTLVTAILCRQLRAQGVDVRAFKPVISGFADDDAQTDTAILLDALGLPATAENIEKMSPWRFRAPLSPDMAAAREGRSISLDAVVAHSRAAMEGEGDVLLIEGVGGVMVPLTADETVLDWMAAVAAPALLVVGSYLGAISHTLTAAEALRCRNVPVHAVIISASEQSPVPVEETAEAMRRFLKQAPIAILPRLGGGDAARWHSAPDMTYLL